MELTSSSSALSCSTNASRNKSAWILLASVDEEYASVPAALHRCINSTFGNERTDSPNWTKAEDDASDDEWEVVVCSDIMLACEPSLSDATTMCS